MSKIVWKFDDDPLSQGIYLLDERADAAVNMLAKNAASTLESDAKEQAKWTDRTGMARKSLKGSVEKTHSNYRIILAHGVDYGIWLELAHEKRFAIVNPLIELHAPFIMEDFKNLMEKMGY